jgi:hypothetical protein
VNRGKDIRGERFGRLLVVDRARREDGTLVWLCNCDCGNTTKVQMALLTRGNTRSCGCLKREVAKTVWGHTRRNVVCPTCNKSFEICRGSKKKYCSKVCYRAPQRSLCGHEPVVCKGLCKPCYNRQYHKAHPENRTAESRRAYYIMANYGLTIEKYKRLVAQNNGGCWICGKVPSKKQKTLNVDHDHSVVL